MVNMKKLAMLNWKKIKLLRATPNVFMFNTLPV